MKFKIDPDVVAVAAVFGTVLIGPILFIIKKVWPEPGPPRHTLSIKSTPVNVSFTLNGETKTTPYSERLLEGEHVASMPGTVSIGSKNYSFARWEDGITTPTRTINLVHDIALTAIYLLDEFVQNRGPGIIDEQPGYRFRTQPGAQLQIEPAGVVPLDAEIVCYAKTWNSSCNCNNYNKWCDGAPYAPGAYVCRGFKSCLREPNEVFDRLRKAGYPVTTLWIARGLPPAGDAEYVGWSDRPHIWQRIK